MNFGANKKNDKFYYDSYLQSGNLEPVDKTNKKTAKYTHWYSRARIQLP